MVSSSHIESVAQRYAPYIDELQDFFSSRKASFGKLADLQAFSDRLRDPAFHEEMVSMVRSILYRESEAVPRTELADMLAIAVAGPQIEDAAPELQPPLHQILIFVTEVVHSQRVTLPPELSLDGDLPGTPAVQPVHDPTSPDLPLTPSPEPHRQPPSEHAAPTSPPPINDRLSRVLIDSAPVVEQSSPVEPAVAATPPEPRSLVPDPPSSSTPKRASSPPQFRKQPASLLSFLRHAYWIPGLCVLLLALGVAYYLHSHAHPQIAAVPEPNTPESNTPLASTDPPKLSVHGAPRTQRQRLATEGSGATRESGGALPNQAAGSRSSADTRLASRTNTNPPPAGPARRNDLHPTLSSSSISPRVLGGREGVFLASSGMMAAHLLTAPAPHYPKLASLTHIEGEVIVQVVVARDGRVEATRVLEGPRLLRSAAEHAIRQWRYRPYLVDGKPTDVATIVTVNFRLSR